MKLNSIKGVDTGDANAADHSDGIVSNAAQQLRVMSAQTKGQNKPAHRHAKLHGKTSAPNEADSTKSELVRNSIQAKVLSLLAVDEALSMRCTSCCNLMV